MRIETALRLSVLLEALRPFALAASIIDPEREDDEISGALFSVGELRRARAALAKIDSPVIPFRADTEQSQ